MLYFNECGIPQHVLPSSQGCGFVIVHGTANNESAGSSVINAPILSFALFPVHAGMPNCVKSSHGLSIYCHFIPGEINLKTNRLCSYNKFRAKCVCILLKKMTSQIYLEFENFTFLLKHCNYLLAGVFKY